ncbi:MAG: NAD(P)/FAD-dependent oxidoreductase [Coleofasciculus sp. B1-GNL1-01]|uniref:NAD(P)/FAD-dependent oxidoreductase n=1 Tax=Coleofasciculus sp. B1-GNL1-01 TaxID=3068484 RepID=UPI0032F81028
MSDLIQQTVILGGGFTGLFTAIHLSRSNYPRSVILIDREERFRFKPLLYEYFSGQMEEPEVMPRFEELLKGSGVTFVQDVVQTIDLHQNRVTLASGTSCPYSNLVLALGSVTGYFGVEGAKENALPFREGKDAIALDQRLRECLIQAMQTQDREQRRRLLTFAIIGGDPTGVELAATLADLLPPWYEAMGGQSQEIRVVLLNRGREILKGDINDPLRDTAHKELQNRAVKVELLNEAQATAVRPDSLDYEQGDKVETLPAATIVWTAGTSTHPLIKDLPIAEEKRDRKGRPLVKPTLQLLEFPDVFAGGDCAAVEGKSLPPTAQVAHQQGDAIASNLQALAKGREPKPADVSIRGTLMKLGLEEAAANISNQVEVDGEIGHLIRQGTYINILPTPLRDFKLTAKWFTEDVYQEYLEPKVTGKTAKVVAGAVVGTLIARKLLKGLGDEDKK